MDTHAGVIVPEVLKGDNYKRWSIFMRRYLVGQDLWDVVQLSKLLDGVYTRREWEKKNALALHAITISCGNEMFDQIKDMDSAKDVWNALADMHKPPLVHLEIVEERRTGPGNLTTPEYETLTKAISNGELSEVENFFRENPNAKSAEVFENGYTVLHFAVYKRKGGIVDYLIKNKLSKDDLTIKDGVGSTALSIAARFGVGKWIAQKLVRKNPDLLTIPDEDGKIPVQLACSTNDEDMTRYLYGETPLESLKGDRGFYIIQECIIRRMFDIAFDLLHHLPELASHDNYPPASIPLILTLSKTPPPFLRWSNLSFWYRVIYNGIIVKAYVIKEDEHQSRVEKIQDSHQSCVKKSTAFFQSCGEMIQEEIMILKNKIQEMIHKSFKDSCVFLLKQLVMSITVSLRALFWIGMLLLLPVELILVGPLILASMFATLFGTRLYHLKLMDEYAKKVRRLICKPQNQLVQSSAVEATFQAIKNGIPDIVKKIIKDNPNILWSSTDPEDSRSRNIFACAVAHRQEEVAHFLYKFADEKNILFTIDENGNNTLHLAAKLPPHYQSGYIHDAALQLRNELRWFKAVKEIVPRAYIEGKNEDNETPLEMFVREHKDLLKEADEWAKKTAASSTVVGALIITIMFAVAFTVPGGNDQSTGFPILLHKTPIQFMICMVSDGISLFAASSSVFVFLRILTSHHSDEDYYKFSLLIYGLASLFVSIATMTIAFCAALFIMLQAQGQWGVVIPITMLAGIPTICYMALQFPLLFEILFFSYSPNISGERGTPFMSSAMANVFTLGLRSLGY